jgi:hypothetical protein
MAASFKESASMRNTLFTIFETLRWGTRGGIPAKFAKEVRCA